MCEKFRYLSRQYKKSEKFPKIFEKYLLAKDQRQSFEMVNTNVE